MSPQLQHLAQYDSRQHRLRDENGTFRCKNTKFFHIVITTRSMRRLDSRPVPMEMIRKVIDAGTRTRKLLEEVVSLER